MRVIKNNNLLSNSESMRIGRQISNFSVEEPVEDQVVGLRRLELRSHVTSTVNCAESESTLVRLGVAGNLTLDVVGSPFTIDSPSECINPVLGTNGGDSTIGVTGVMQHLDLTLELLVDPLGGLRLRNVVPCACGLAKIPSLNVVRDVHSLANFITVHVVKKLGAECAWWEIV
jgi:hypothetical protein